MPGTEIKVEEMCRTCLTDGTNLLSLYDYPTQDDYMHNPKCIRDILNTTIPQLRSIRTTDGLPQGICVECIKQLLTLRDFQKLCLRSESRMRELLLTADTSPGDVMVKLPNARDTPMRDPLASTRNEEAARFEAESNESSSYSEGNDIGMDDTLEDSPDCKEERNELSTRSPKNEDEADLSSRFLYHNCNLCDKHYQSLRALRLHEKRIHNLSQRKGEKGKPICEYCNKNLSSMSKLREHLNIHTGEEPYLCSDCGKRFKNNSNFKQHLKRHSGVKSYECPECPKKFLILSDLNCHKTVHSKEKRFVCDICNKGFTRKEMLNTHKLYHTGEKPFKCDHCEATFVKAYHRQRHLRQHTGERPYRCKYCEHSYRESSHLNRHMRTHVGDNIYECELCPRSFRLRSELFVHFITHKSDDEDTRKRHLEEKEQKLKLPCGLSEKQAYIK